ncbi:MAG: rRNA maturation RNase YbeY [Marinilabiliaceae bacterium]|nr:rRNA maturation RNase YbeY [Marinilabiliaceae bacterium]
MINIITEGVEFPDIEEDRLNKWINSVVEQKDKCIKDLSLVFCSDEYILDVNQNYLQHDYYTDIITFDYCSGCKISGDLIISLDTVLSNSQKFNTSYNTELHRVIIHGVLHLLGYKDKTPEEAKEMRQNEDLALKQFETIA